MIVNSEKMLLDAKKNKYAVAHFNINNLEWTKYILETCQALQVPVILGVSEGAIKYMGGYNTVASLVKGLDKDLKLTIPVCLHLDHGASVEACSKAIAAGFTSVMIDGSKFPLTENIRLTKEVVKMAHYKNVTVEAEIGHIGGSDVGSADQKYFAKLDDCLKLYQETKIDSIAPALGSVHGLYKGKPNLDYNTMRKINDNLPIPLVLHGGTGLSKEDIAKAIDCGIAKVNINTDLQITWCNSVREFLLNNKDVYDPRKVISSGEMAVKKRIEEFVTLFKTPKISKL